MLYAAQIINKLQNLIINKLLVHKITATRVDSGKISIIMKYNKQPLSLKKGFFLINMSFLKDQNSDSEYANGRETTEWAKKRGENHARKKTQGIIRKRHREQLNKCVRDHSIYRRREDEMEVGKTFCWARRVGRLSKSLQNCRSRNIEPFVRGRSTLLQWTGWEHHPLSSGTTWKRQRLYHWWFKARASAHTYTSIHT